MKGSSCVCRTFQSACHGPEEFHLGGEHLNETLVGATGTRLLSHQAVERVRQNAWGHLRFARRKDIRTMATFGLPDSRKMCPSVPIPAGGPCDWRTGYQLDVDRRALRRSPAPVSP